MNPTDNPDAKWRYLGDGVYGCHDPGFDQFWLATQRDNGWHTIALDMSTLAAFERLLKDTAEELL
jgi:hypothetical protein